MAASDELREAIEHAEQLAEQLGYTFVAHLLAMAREETHRTIRNESDQKDSKDGIS